MGTAGCGYERGEGGCGEEVREDGGVEGWEVGIWRCGERIGEGDGVWGERIERGEVEGEGTALEPVAAKIEVAFLI